MSVFISVVTATYNSGATIDCCLRSVASQTWPLREHIVIDGKSSDNTLDLVRAAEPRPTKVVCEADDGIYDALNKGIKNASGDVVGFLHSDDYFSHSEVLSTVARAFEDPYVCAVYGDLDFVHKEDTSRIVRKWRSCVFERAMLKKGWMPPHPTLYVRREWYLRTGCFDSSYRISGDYLSILRLFSHPAFKSVHLPEVLVKMRTGGVSTRSPFNLWLKSREDLRALRACGVGGYRTLWQKNLSKITQLI